MFNDFWGWSTVYWGSYISSQSKNSPTVHLTPTSSTWAQLWVPIGRWGQALRVDSLPLHPRSSSQICWELGPLGNPVVRAIAPVVEKPSCLQATWASGVPNPSSHTVPQILLLQNSNLPVKLLAPPCSLNENWVQANKKGHSIKTSCTKHCALFYWKTGINGERSNSSV